MRRLQLAEWSFSEDMTIPDTSTINPLRRTPVASQHASEERAKVFAFLAGPSVHRLDEPVRRILKDGSTAYRNMYPLIEPGRHVRLRVSRRRDGDAATNGRA
jgi:hypothetical protein